MGRDEEVPEHFGMLHGENLTPHRAIWVLATISAVLGAYAALYYFAGGSAPDDKTIATLPHNIWYAIGMSSNAYLAALPNGLLLVTLTSNFGTFLLYGLTNIVCIVAFREPRVPWLQAHGRASLRRDRELRLPCLLYHRTTGRFGSVKEPLIAVGISAIWAVYGAIYFIRNSKKKGKETILVAKPA